MLSESEYTMSNLFAQLGLDNSAKGIDDFIKAHQLAQGESLKDAKVWSDSQRAFLIEEWGKNCMWVQVIDDLNLLMSQIQK
ncbi:Protein of unknown function [Colwellia chukchiensis]|uniref:DUF2789 domain-containing protein n=1 Tax=Colwellia chukchiensis TaxID=641665 RepID=A0A1H7SKR3_9GAMM|nr:DUF2789 family protein [Colwellia chukchiensis]SEL73202.1 Protein of unknown function [Colwellia chukchiensis]